MNIVAFGEVLIDCLPEQNVIGGAPFNVAIHLKRFENNVTFLSQIADDEFGNLIYDFAKQENIEQGISFDKNHPTGYVTVDFVDNEPHYTIEEQKSWQYVEYSPLQACDVYIFGSLALYFEKNKKVFLQHKTENPDALFVCDLNLRGHFYSPELISFCIQNSNVLKVNDDEWKHLQEIYQQDTDEKLLAYIKDELNTIKIIRTRSEKGAVLYWDGEFVEASTTLVPQELFQDAVGAGDGFLSSFLNTYFKENNLQTALENALEFAANICKYPGAIPVEKTIY